MEIILYIYFAINLFIAGYWFNENNRFYNHRYTFSIFVLSVLFGVLGYLIYFLFLAFSPILGWLYREIRFQYRFYFTSYWDKIFLDDNYSEEYRTKEEKLERSKEISKHFSKQGQRHNKQIQKKYGK